MKHGWSRIVGITAVMAGVSTGCLGDATPEPEIARVTLALDNDDTHPDDGKTCYQDVPMRKGKMSLGMCCFDDPVKGTSVCVVCDKEHTCTVGGATPGALEGGGGGGVVSGGVGGGVLDPGTTTPPRLFRSVTLENRALASD